MQGSICAPLIVAIAVLAFLGMSFRKGGIKQRLNLGKSASSDSAAADSHVETFARKKIKSGKFSAADVNDLCGDAKSSEKNASRNLLRRMNASATFPEVYVAPIVAWDAVNACKTEVDAHFLLPYEVLDHVGSAEWASLDASEHSVSVARKSWGERLNPPMDDTSEIVPLSLWGDSAPLSKKNGSLYMLLWSVLRVSFSKRFWIVCFSKDLLCQCGCAGRCTIDSALRVVVWACQVMLAGVWPAFRDDGTAFAASTRQGDVARAKRAGSRLKVRGAMLAKKGDWAWLKQVVNLASWSSSSRCCWLCRANHDNMTDATGAAEWRQTMVSNLEFQQEQEGSYRSVLWGLPGFILAYIDLDLMRVADLGISQALVGNCIFELFKELGGVQAHPDKTLGELLTLISIASKHLGFDRPINGLTLLMFKQPGKTPRMRTKAAETRHLVVVVDWLFTEMFQPKNPHAVLRQRCVKQLALFYEELRIWGPGSPQRAAVLGRTHVILYAELLREALASGDWENSSWHPWRFYPKHHLFVHLAEVGIARAGNPKAFWCYQDENAIGEAVKIGKACHCKYVHRSIIDKYRL